MEAGGPEVQSFLATLGVQDLSELCKALSHNIKQSTQALDEGTRLASPFSPSKVRLSPAPGISQILSLLCQPGVAKGS